MNIKSKWLWTPLAALVLWTGSARAEDPAPDAKAKMLQQHRLQTESRFKEHQTQREQVQKNPGGGPWLHRAARPIARSEIEVRIEDLRDGAILYSVPVEKGQEKVVREVKTRAEVQHRRIFAGRYYRQVRAAAKVDWRSMIGKDVRLRLEAGGARSGGSIAMDAKVK